MKNIWKFMLSMTLLAGLATVGLAQAEKPAKAGAKADKVAPKATKFMGKGDGITSCPVTGEEIHNKDIHGDFFGRTVYFCCAGCLAKAQKNPAMYLKKNEAAQKAAVQAMTKEGAKDAKHEDHQHGETANTNAAAGKFLGKGDGIESCPVTGEPVNKNLKGEALGRTYYVCCEGCLATVKNNPSAYLKPAASAPATQPTAFLGKGDGVETCPVTGEPVDKKLVGEANGQKFAVCCAGCLDTVKANPAAYLKSAKR